MEFSQLIAEVDVLFGDRFPDGSKEQFVQWRLFDEYTDLLGEAVTSYLDPDEERLLDQVDPDDERAAHAILLPALARAGVDPNALVRKCMDDLRSSLLADEGLRMVILIAGAEAYWFELWGVRSDFQGPNIVKLALLRAEDKRRHDRPRRLRRLLDVAIGTDQRAVAARGSPAHLLAVLLDTYDLVDTSGREVWQRLQASFDEIERELWARLPGRRYDRADG